VRQAQAASLRLAETTAQRVSTLFSLYRTGRMSLAEFKARAAAVIATANTAGVQIADIAVAAEATRQLGRSVGPAGLAPTSVQMNADRIGRDIDRVIAADPDVIDLADSRDSRLRQLARSEPLLSTATAAHTAMSHHGATGWVRVLDADPCKVCRGWADGVVRSVGTAMARHNGCGCIQQPVF
jgi:hypothetical protein